MQGASALYCIHVLRPLLPQRRQSTPDLDLWQCLHRSLQAWLCWAVGALESHCPALECGWPLPLCLTCLLLCSLLFFKLRKLMLKDVDGPGRHPQLWLNRWLGLFFWCLLETTPSASYLVHISISAFQKSKHGKLHIYSTSCAGWWGKPSGNEKVPPSP